MRAFADDTALVTDNFHSTASTIHSLFREFAAISSLRLNMPKTVMIPLWRSTPDQVRRMVKDEHPSWKEVEVTYAARYLGVILGPDSVHKSWEKATDRFTQRCLQWCTLHLGIQYACRVYRTFCFSTLGFIAQLFSAPEETIKAEMAALRRFFPGPGNWATPQDLYRLKLWFGFPYAFPDLHLTSVAARLRVLQNDAADHAQRVQTIQLESIIGPYRHPEWASWYSNSITLQLESARLEAAELGVTDTAIRARHQHPRGLHNTERKIFQKTVYLLLLEAHPGNAEFRIRHKLERWRIPTPVSLLARRAHNRLQRAFDLVPPRVAVVLFSTLWNRWCTARRFQEEGTCIFGYSGQNLDSVEHDSVCPKQTAFAKHTLHIPEAHVGSLTSFFGLDPNISDDLLTIIMINTYTCYTARNKLKHCRPDRQHGNYSSLMLQIAKQGTFGHSRSRQLLERFLRQTP